MKYVILSSMLLHALLAGSSGAFAASEEPISLQTPSGALSGSLLLPNATGQIPVVLIIAGSGPTDRDGNQMLMKNNSLKMLAKALADGGFASVRYDKRGIGASVAAYRNEADVIFSDFVNDAAAWITLLAADKRFSAVAVAGHSEGSTIGMLAAQKSPADAYISIAGPAQNAAMVLRWQLDGKLPADRAKQHEDILSSLERGQVVADIPPQLMPLYRPSIQPYVIDWFKFVPVDELKKLQIPCLIVQGDTDIQVPVSSAQALHDAKPDAELAIIEGMNHILKVVPNDSAQQLASYRDPSLPIARTLAATVNRFLSTATGRDAKH